MTDQTIEASQSASTRLNMPALSLAALGVVFGDIGTSPLYTLKTVLDVTGGAHSEPAAILGALSLSLLFRLKPSDPLTLAAAGALLAAIAARASFLPARQATRVDPMVALRYE